jgi:alkylation response protein AidB-like acyl-CoA dehydrogenase
MMLSDEQRMIRDMARNFAATQLKPFAAAWDREARFPADAIAEMGRLGLMGMLVPPMAAPAPIMSPTRWRSRRSRRATAPPRPS